MNSLPILHNKIASRFEIEVEGHLCVAEYRLVEDVLQMFHTEVSPQLQGRGIAAALVQAACTYARQHQLRIQPLCSYVRVYMERHPEIQDLRA